MGTINFKYGISKPGWNNSNGSTNTVKVRVLHVDEFRIGDQGSIHAEVAPR